MRELRIDFEVEKKIEDGLLSGEGRECAVQHHFTVPCIGLWIEELPMACWTAQPGRVRAAAAFQPSTHPAAPSCLSHVWCLARE